MSRQAPAPCPLTEVVGDYILRCVLTAGHDGCCWAADLEQVKR